MVESTIHIKVSAALDTAVASSWSSRVRSGRPPGTFGDAVAGAGEEIAGAGVGVVLAAGVARGIPQEAMAQVSAARNTTRGGRPGAAMGSF
ncbi:hypothetical protein GCM10010187_61410 [Actinomadura coerulea]|nr:hypothetical protein GCM10010187_61410 [Actinomadura coerulea]